MTSNTYLLQAIKILPRIAGWAPDSDVAEDFKEVISYLWGKGWIDLRLHTAPIGKWPMFRVTSDGLAQLDLNDQWKVIRQHSFYKCPFEIFDVGTGRLA